MNNNEFEQEQHVNIEGNDSVPIDKFAFYDEAKKILEECSVKVD